MKYCFQKYYTYKYGNVEKNDLVSWLGGPCLPVCPLFCCSENKMNSERDDARRGNQGRAARGGEPGRENGGRRRRGNQHRERS